jgi:homoserine O-acetyltransferase
MRVYQYNKSLVLESGKELSEIAIAYHTWGKLNKEGNNVIWICHALTANSAAQEWWKGLIGDGLAFDTKNYLVVCDNILGSCYGTTGPASINPDTGRPFHSNFPAITVRDMAAVHELLRQHLNIKKIHLLVGGSMGGYQALEWCVMQPHLVRNLFLLTTSAKESAWGIAIHTAQRMAIELDGGWQKENGGKEGLKIARAIGMLTYRGYETFLKMQSDDEQDKLDDFKASSYIKYQGEKLAARFSPHSYWLLTKAMDTHNLARGREDLTTVLQTIEAKTLIIGITSDILCPLAEQQIIADAIPDATFAAINSVYGHDGFLVETEAITKHLSAWLKP